MPVYREVRDCSRGELTADGYLHFNVLLRLDENVGKERIQETFGQERIEFLFEICRHWAL